MRFSCLIFFGFCICKCVAIYPDQIGKFDWQLENIGNIKELIYQSKKAFFASHSGVIGSISVRTGELEWRKVLESDDSIDAIVSSRKHLVSLSKSGNLVRMWQANDGVLLWDASTLSNPPPVQTAERTKALPAAKIAVLPESQSVVVLAHNSVYFFASTTGMLTWQWYPDAEEDTQNVLSGLAGKAIELTSLAVSPVGSTVVVAGYYEEGSVRHLISFSLSPAKESWSLLTSLTQQLGISTDPFVVKSSDSTDLLAVAPCADGLLVESTEGSSYVIPLDKEQNAGTLKPVTGADNGLLQMKRGKLWEVLELSASKSLKVLAACENENCIMGAYSTPAGLIFLATATRLDDSQIEIRVTDRAGSQLTQDVYSLHKTQYGQASTLLPQVFERKDGSLGSRSLLSAQEHTLFGLQASSVLWQRHEALAHVVQAVFVDKPKMSEITEEGSHHLPSFLERIELQKRSLLEMFLNAKSSITGLLLPDSDEEKPVTGSKLPHSFGFEKIAICLTQSNKLFALNLLDGQIIWSKLLEPSLWTKLYATRPSTILGYAPEIVVASSKGTSSTFLMLDGITGKQTGTLNFEGEVQRMVPLPQIHDSHQRTVIMVVDNQRKVSFFPDTKEVHQEVSRLLPQLFFHLLNKTSGEIASYMLRQRLTSSEQYTTVEIAAAVFPTNSEQIVAVQYPELLQHESQPAQVLGDDSLLLKYLNPHLMVVATVSVAQSEIEQSVLFITLVDAVSGEILHRISHPHGKDPVHITVNENWVVYSFWDGKAHRTQMGAVSLYEGFIDKHGLNPFNQPEQEKNFSAFAAHPPIILQKTYIFPHSIRALATTTTRFGTTSKHILVGLETGQVLGLDRRIIDPRRPEKAPKKQEAMEGLAKYNPFIPVIPMHMVSYYRQIERISAIYSVPTTMESTTLLMATGLDIYSTRVNPSKTFDLLPEEFNRILLSLILIVMTVVTIVLGKFVHGKQLNAKWA